MQEKSRTQRAYDQLFKALTDLLAEKPFDEIRVTDLCERAGVHRSTFYAHFEDKRHLLTFAIQELMDIFIPPASLDPDRDYQQAMLQAMRRVFKYFLKNKQEYTLLFLDPRNAAAKDVFYQEYIRSFRYFLRQRYPNSNAADRDLFSHHFIGGLLTLVGGWLARGADPSPDEMASRFVRLIPSHESIFLDYMDKPPEDKAAAAK